MTSVYADQLKVRDYVQSELHRVLLDAGLFKGKGKRSSKSNLPLTLPTVLSGNKRQVSVHFLSHIENVPPPTHKMGCYLIFQK